ncbi:MAG TPA: DNA-3-methyladenine glycosylase [Cytophagales bacterium]|nr:DNA-3-methyladenine glycosylase [Cytophagales bacterium]
MKLPAEYYQGEDVVAIAKDLLGKLLITSIDGQFTSGVIVETEAYNGRCDRACHAFGRRTPRTEVLYKAGGLSYVYLCYGIHSLFNIATNVEGKADAVLIRAIEPVEGVEVMLKRRKMDVLKPQLTAGPGSLSEALGITTRLTGTPLSGSTIWLEDNDKTYDSDEILIGTRVGVAYAKEDALLPWRFRVKDNKWISKAK